MDTTPAQTCFGGSAAAALRQAVPHTISITYRGEHISNSPSVAAVGAAPIDFPVPLAILPAHTNASGTDGHMRARLCTRTLADMRKRR